MVLAPKFQNKHKSQISGHLWYSFQTARILSNSKKKHKEKSQNFTKIRSNGFS